MKNVTFILSLAFILLFANVNAQTFYRLDFNTSSVTKATIGPDPISCHPHAATSSGAAHLSGVTGGSAGLDIRVPGSLFSSADIKMTFNYRRQEGQASFFKKSNFELYMNGGRLYIKYQTKDASGIPQNYGPYNTGYSLPYDNNFHKIEFEYRAMNGMATISIDGTPVWTMDGGDNEDLRWVGSSDAYIGKKMDASGRTTGTLDYAEFSIPAALPVELLFFTAEKMGEEVMLHWATATESNNDFFTVERSVNGTEFAEIEKVDGAGSSNSRNDYQTVDFQPTPGVNYYRIKQTDFDGSVTYSNVVEVEFTDDNTALNMVAYPNPVAQGQAIHVNTSASETASVSLMTLQGQTIYTQTATAGQSISIPTEGLSKGVYLVIAKNNQQIAQQKVIIQ